MWFREVRGSLLARDAAPRFVPGLSPKRSSQSCLASVLQGLAASKPTRPAQTAVRRSKAEYLSYLCSRRAQRLERIAHVVDAKAAAAALPAMIARAESNSRKIGTRQKHAEHHTNLPQAQMPMRTHRATSPNFSGGARPVPPDATAQPLKQKLDAHPNMLESQHHNFELQRRYRKLTRR